MPKTENPSLFKATERENKRWMLFFFDIIFMLAAFGAQCFLSRGTLSGYTFLQLLPQFLTALVCVTLSSLAFRVYNTVLRRGEIGSFSRITCSYIVGGFVYIVFQRFVLPVRFTADQSTSFIAFALIISLFARFVYYYMIVQAEHNTPLGRFLEYILRVCFRVDLTSEDATAVVPVGVHEKRVPDSINEVQRVIRQFAIHGRVKDIQKINKGYVNRTYHIVTETESGHEHHYLLQRINVNAFRDVDALMENYVLVAEHLSKGFSLPGGKPKVSSSLVKTTKDGTSYLRDDSGCWRMLSYYLDVYSLDLPDDPKTFYYTGVSYGRFLKRMADIPVEKINVVIPDFHNTYKRYLRLEEVYALNPVKRAENVANEMAFIRLHKDKLDIITHALETGSIPTRICHNDCNLNNLLFSNDNHKPVAVIDLDTVMPSSPLCDFGDSMRIGTNTAKDDEQDLSKVSCDLALYEQYARGYLEACGDMLTKEELMLLPYSSVVISMEDGIRFLCDYIEGDVYYNIFYHNQNLYRSRTQLQLAADMENKMPQIKQILQTIYDELELDANLF